MPGRIEFREPDDQWGGRQPKFESLVMRGPRRFALTVRLLSGERVDVPLTAGLTVEMRPERPPGEPNE